ncbi:hypothetical protein [Streptomyces sp. KL116D]|uniref:hypothetical protein n=1 Tax=Streptomyces sp. KL116D TaxID=3045152 RepID=UPI0035568E54
MSIVQDLRTRGRHKGLTPWQLIQKIGRLEREADVRDCQLMGFATDNDELRRERNELKDSLDAAAVDYAGVLHDLDAANAEVERLRAELANRDAVTVPPMERDTTAIEDQATAPIDVTTLREAAAAGRLGPVVQVSHSGASADPGLPRTTTWGLATAADDETQQLPKIPPAA